MSAHTETEPGARRESTPRHGLILDAAIRLFARESFFRVGMREIAAEAGVSPALIYRHFPDQEALFLEVLDRERGRLIELLQARAATPGCTPADLAEAYLRFMADHDAFFQMMTHFAIAGPLLPARMERYRAAERRLVAVFQDVLDGGTRDARLRAHALQSALNGILISFRTDPERSPDEVRGHMVRLGRLTAERLAGSGVGE